MDDFTSYIPCEAVFKHAKHDITALLKLFIQAMGFNAGLIIPLLILVSAIPLPNAPGAYIGLTRHAERDAVGCDQPVHPGNPDFYGFGIRLGVYLQVFCSMLGMVDIKYEDNLYDFHDANSVLLLAIFVALVKSTPSREIELVDVIILLRLLWLIILCGFSLGHLKDEYKKAKRSRELLPLVMTQWAFLFRCIVACGVAAYNVWFWFSGVSFFRRGISTTECPTYAFFFAKLAADGGLQTFYKFTSVILVLMPPTWVVAYLVFLIGFSGAVVGFASALVAVMLVPEFVLISVLMLLLIYIYFDEGRHRGIFTGMAKQRIKKAPFFKRLEQRIQLFKKRWKIPTLGILLLYASILIRLTWGWSKVRQDEKGEEKRKRSGTINLRTPDGYSKQ